MGNSDADASTNLDFKCPSCGHETSIALGTDNFTADRVPPCSVCGATMNLVNKATKTAVNPEDERAIEEAINAYRLDNPHSRMIR